MNYDLARESFVDMGEVVLRSIYDVLYYTAYNRLDEY